MRVVRSAKDKAWDEMKDKVGKINNALKINDWTIVEGEFDELSKRIEAKKVRRCARACMHATNPFGREHARARTDTDPSSSIDRLTSGAAGVGRAGRAALLHQAAGHARGQAQRDQGEGKTVYAYDMGDSALSLSR